MSEPESPDAFESHRQPGTPGPVEGQPDWLVGAEEGVHAERSQDAEPAPHLKLVRPVAGESPAPGAARKPAKPQAWKAAASSVPRLQRVEGAATAARASAPGKPASPAWAGPGLDAAPAGRDGSPLDDLPFDDPSASGGYGHAPGESVAAAAPPAARPTALDEPWWAIALDEIQTNRVVQLGVLAVLLAVLAWFMWPRSEPTVSIRSIHEHPERFDGATVRVQGRVGDVYEVGSAFAFYLEQGRDTIVVFSRTRRPYRNEKLQVAGSVSMGYLDGIARPSLFESPE